MSGWASVSGWAEDEVALGLAPNDALTLGQKSSNSLIVLSAIELPVRH
jgi:hypothetical protein